MTVLESPEQKATRTMLERHAAETGDRTLLDLYLAEMAAIGNDEMMPPTDLKNPAARAQAFATPDGEDYFEVQILPPTELFRFLGESDAGDLGPRELAAIERQVVDWCTKRYAPPAHLGFYLDYSEALVAVGAQAPLELWLTRRQWCAGY